MPIRPGVPTTEVVLVDLTGDQPRLLERSTYDGQYVSARLVGGTLRLVTTTRPQPEVVYPTEPGPVAEQRARAANEQAAAGVGLSDVLPQVVRRDADGTVLEHGAAVACDQTFHAPHPSGASTLLVTTIRPGDGLAATDRTAVTTDGDLVYAAEDRLYVATSRWGTVAPLFGVDDTSGAVARSLPEEVRTEIHAFDTSSETETEYVGSGSVPGYVLGQWALSRYDGALRVATTRQPPWEATAPDGSPGSVAETSSMVVKLAERDGALVETGRVGGLGKGEQIRAVRYFGDIAAVVTFRQTDPLYLLDLSGAAAGRRGAEGARLLHLPAPARQRPADGPRPGRHQHRSGLRHAGLRVRRLRPLPPGAPGPAAARQRLVGRAGRLARLRLRPGPAARDLPVHVVRPRRGWRSSAPARSVSR